MNDDLTARTAQEWRDERGRAERRKGNGGQRPKERQKPPALPPWLADAVCDAGGRPLPVLANIMIALRTAPQIEDTFNFDEMLRAPILMRALPMVRRVSVDLGPYPRPVRDTDVSQLQDRLQHEGLPKIGMNVTRQAVELRARDCSFHPVRIYLDGLLWDRKPRLDDWLSTYLGAAPSPYVKAIGRMFLIAMVARIFEPGCKADYMLVLEGEQGARKSAACAVLAGQWFSDQLPDIHARNDKDTSQHLRGKWLIEVAELSATSRAETEHLKAFITRRVEHYRPSYGRLDVDESRQCVFIGTTNKRTYLRDETGARRYWPVGVGKIDLDKLSKDRDQLFAEAVHRYHEGERWWPNEAFEREHIKPQQDDRFEGDPWDDLIADYVANLSRVRVTDIARQALFIESAKIGTSDQRRIASILTGLGWEPVRDWQGRAFIRNHDA
jgi:predicted P-loop ATPase